MTHNPMKFLFSLIVLLAHSANAQVVVHRRRPSVGRIIAGCVVGGIFAIFLLCLLLRMSRRRSARFTAVQQPGGAPTNYNHKPLFGGPWGRSNNIPMHHQQSEIPNQNNSYNNFAPTGPQQQGYPQYNSEYPNQNAPPPPPAYGKGADYGRNYVPPQSPPPGHAGNQQTVYTPPVGPPPQAHTTGQDNTFVGGFRS